VGNVTAIRTKPVQLGLDLAAAFASTVFLVIVIANVTEGHSG